MSSDLHVVDFFSGCGGTSLGFRNAGLKIAAGIDYDPHSAATFRQNFPEATFFETDIRALSPSAIRRAVGDRPMLFSGCAPCQPFSRQNQQRSVDDPRRSLLLEFQRFVLKLRPAYVVVENVPGAQRIAGEAAPFAAFTAKLRRVGYDVESDVLRAGDFGVPQKRRRLVIVASLDDAARLPFAGDDATEKTTVRSAIGHLPQLEAGAVDPQDPDHATMRLSSLNLQRIQSTPEGGGRGDWPERLRLECHQDHAGHSDVYGRMSWDRPASGLTTRCLSYSNGRFGHPEQDRAISAREAACLQTFPDDFAFCGPLTEKGRQIGNAVPPKFAQRIVEALLG